MTLFTKCVHNKSSGRAADDKITIKQKKIAANQLRLMTGKIESLLLTAYSASKNKPELAVEGIRAIIANCFIADNHVYCEGASDQEHNAVVC